MIWLKLVAGWILRHEELAAWGLVAGLALGMAGLIHHKDTVIVRQRAQVAQQQADTRAARQDVEAVRTANKVISQGADRDAAVASTHEENRHAIETSAGADAPVAPAVNDVGRRGLCRYQAYADDPDCLQLAGARQPA